MKNEAARLTKAKPAPVPSRHTPAAAVVAASVAGLIAAWLAAGSAGLLGHGLRHAATWLALGAALAYGWPAPRASRWTGLLATLAAACAMTASSQAPVNVMAAALVMLYLAAMHGGIQRSVLLSSAFAVSAFSVYRVLYSSASVVWSLADGLGGLMGHAAGGLAHRPLLVGPAFGGVDFIVLMLAWTGAWAVHAEKPRWARVAWGLLAVAAAQTAYLLLAAFASDLAALLPPFKPEVAEGFWTSALRHTVPWNVPAAGVILHALAAAAMARWGIWREKEEPDGERGPRHVFRVAMFAGCGVAFAAILGLSTTLTTRHLDLTGKKIVFFEKGYLNWLAPKHEDYGRLSIGMYGLLPHFVRSLGANAVMSPDLSARDIEGADALVIIYPDKPWDPGQLQRIWDFVNRGGALCLFGEHTVREKNGGDRFNELLEPTAIRVLYDSATFAVGGWLQSYEALSHVTTFGLPDERNEFGIVIGASLAAPWPARPLIMGRWGWSDWGDPGHSSMMGNHVYDPGERLGDVILAAEQRVGRGRVLVFGDTSSIANGINVGSYVFTSRVFGYLADRGDDLQAPWRVLFAALASLLLIGLFAVRARPAETAVILAALALCRIAGSTVTARGAEMMPDSANDAEYKVAYIDASRPALYSSESWRDDGLMGLALNLMRNGYQVFMMHDLSAERLSRASLFVSVAPAESYTEAERQAIRRFVEQGGVFILTVGYDARGPSLSLLREFGLTFGEATASGEASPIVKPLGFFKSPYLRHGDQAFFVRFHAAWPVRGVDPGTVTPIAYGRGDIPVIVLRRVGKGKMVFVGDSSFAMNRNLEVESGAAFEGMRENPHFWRWLLTYLQDKPAWIPPAPAPAEAALGATEGQP